MNNAPIIEGLLTPKELADWRSKLTNPESWLRLKAFADEMLVKLGYVEHSNAEAERERAENAETLHHDSRVLLADTLTKLERSEAEVELLREALKVAEEGLTYIAANGSEGSARYASKVSGELAAIRAISRAIATPPEQGGTDV